MTQAGWLAEPDKPVSYEKPGVDTGWPSPMKLIHYEMKQRQRERVTKTDGIHDIFLKNTYFPHSLFPSIQTRGRSRYASNYF